MTKVLFEQGDRLAVTFEEGRDGSPITRVNGKVSFPERGGKLPKVGETWEVELAGTNPKGTVHFLRLIRRAEQAIEPTTAPRETFFVKFTRSGEGRKGVHGRAQAFRGKVVLPSQRANFSPQPSEGWEVEVEKETERALIVRPVSGPYRVIEYESRSGAASQIINFVEPVGKVSARARGGAGQASFEVVYYFYTTEQVASFEEAMKDAPTLEDAERVARRIAEEYGLRVSRWGRYWAVNGEPKLVWFVVRPGPRGLELVCASLDGTDKEEAEKYLYERYGSFLAEGPAVRHPHIKYVRFDEYEADPVCPHCGAPAKWALFLRFVDGEEEDALYRCGGYGPPYGEGGCGSLFEAYAGVEAPGRP